MKDTSIDAAIKKALADQKDQAAGQCPDENILAAYLEMRLDQAERQSVEHHASGCIPCQQTIGLALQLSEPEVEPLAGEAETSSRKRVLFHISMPVSMIAMIVLALLAGFLFYRVLRESTRIRKAEQTAELRVPSRVDGISAAKAPVASPPKEQAVPEKSKDTASVALRPLQAPPASVTSVPGISQPIRSPAPVPESPAGETQALTALPVSSGGKTPVVASGGVETGIPVSAPRAEVAADINLPRTPESAPPVAAQMLEAKAGGSAADKSAVTAANMSNKMSTSGGTAGASRELGVMKLTAARSAPAAKPQALEQWSSEVTPPDAVLKLAALISSGRNMPAPRKVADRTFYLNSGYWIDSQCTAHLTAEFVELGTDSTEYREILKSLPELEKSRPAVVFWNAKNCVLRAVGSGQ